MKQNHHEQKPKPMRPIRTTTIANQFVAAILEGAKQRGYDTSIILERAGISPSLINENQARIYPDSFARLYKEVATTLDDELLGLSKARSKVGAFATMCQLVIHARTLKIALNRGMRFYRLFDLNTFSEMEVDGDVAHLIIHDNEPQRQLKSHFLVESQLVIWHRLASWLIGQRIPLLQASFSYPPPSYVSEYELLFYCPLAFEQGKISLTFESRYLNAAIEKDEEQLNDMLREAPGSLLVKPNNNSSVTTQIRRLLSRDFEAGMRDFESIATELNTTSQTLRRKLKQENTSFQEIKNQVRRDLAIYHLSQSKLGLDQIAQKVGFTETSTFHRAFKKWTGVTPGHYRYSDS